MTDVLGAGPIAERTARPGRKSAAAFRTISEVASELDVPSHVLRFWETKFAQIRPMKRGGGRRYYRPEDIALLQRIRSLLYDDGYTIKGVQKLLRDGGFKKASATEAASPNNLSTTEANEGPEISSAKRAELQDVLTELVSIKKMLSGN
ncbi:MAG: transcriptional regulator [Rhodospirillaceae bacterium]|nr:transcriptional regulator [Rhodospirillaceae bacterium]|tara:strand:+ start:16008 stop:16454 length:447 start_codon:yes stop_codon:yes gene_type:complete